MISYGLLSSFLYIFLKAIYAYEKEFEKPGNRQQATPLCPASGSRSHH